MGGGTRVRTFALEVAQSHANQSTAFQSGTIFNVSLRKSSSLMSTQTKSQRVEDEPLRLHARGDLPDAAENLIQLARRAGLTILTVESCTAGAMAAVLANSDGAGDAFHGGFVVYSKEHKTKAAGVPAALIEQHTAVSAPVAQSMANGGLENSPADIALAITGVAGPEPDEDGNPVGLVFVAAARKGVPTIGKKLFLSGTKEEICRDAMLAALQLGADIIREN